MAKTKITSEQYALVEADASAAQEILEDERFQFFRDYLRNIIDTVEQKILTNAITEARETVTVTDKIIRTFVRPKKEQVDEMVGQYKAIKKIFDDLQSIVDNKKQVDKALEKKEILLDDRTI